MPRVGDAVACPKTDVGVVVAATPVAVAPLVAVKGVIVRLGTGVSVFVATGTKLGVDEGSAKRGVTVALGGTVVGEG